MRYLVLVLVLALCAAAAAYGAQDDAPGLVLGALVLAAIAVVLTVRDARAAQRG